MKRLIVVGGIFGAVLLGSVATLSFMEDRRFSRHLEALRGDLRLARATADSCALVLTWEEQDFLDFDAFVDSLHHSVRSFEDIEQGGVPQAEYSDYLEDFERYNDSVAVWQTKADALQSTEASCRALAEAHNALSDSLAGLLRLHGFEVR
jgi:hypothetical protein